MRGKFRYCPYCASSIVEEVRFNAVRPVCSACGFVQFHDPKVAVIALVVHRRRVLLIQRAVDPAKGKWSLPGGYMDAGEMPQEALKRELKEEVGLSVKIGELIEIFPMVNEEEERIGIVLAFEGEPSGSPDIPFVADDAQDAGWFCLGEIPSDLAFESTETLLNNWKASSSEFIEDVCQEQGVDSFSHSDEDHR
ncbi:MAG: NUDIX domain-containing protein [Caldilineaceae bacterium]|nr:NUDIX domain-containing protein [Caldilineaceae bacterium]